MEPPRGETILFLPGVAKADCRRLIPSAETPE
jgi:hypothetical protein